MRLSERLWQTFWRENVQWLLASLVLAFGIWVIAVLQTDPIQQRTYARVILIEFRLDENMMMGDPSQETAQVTIRAPRSVWDVLRGDQVHVVADLRGQREGEHLIDLDSYLSKGVRGQIIEVTPAQITVTLARFASQRVPVRADVTQEPPSGYSYPTPTCDLTEVTARGPASALDGIVAVARLNLSNDRSPISRQVNLFPVDTEGRAVSNVTIEPSQINCEVEITQNAGVFEISVLPEVQGFPPSGYIYEGFEFEPKTVLVTGRRSAIREMNGVIRTEPITLANATSSFERTVSLVLPEGVTLQPETQNIQVNIQIGTARGSRQYTSIPIQIEGAPAGVNVGILPNSVTVFVVGPEPFLQQLTSEALRVTVNVADLTPGSYQREAQAQIVVESLSALANADTSITVQPPEINVVISIAETTTP